MRQEIAALQDFDRADDRSGSKARITAPQHCCPLHAEVPPGMWLELRAAISSDVKLSDCRLAFKQRSGREGEPLGSPLVSFSRGVRYLSTPLF